MKTIVHLCTRFGFPLEFSFIRILVGFYFVLIDVNCYKLLKFECQVPNHWVYQIGNYKLFILGFGFTSCIASDIISVTIKIDILLVGLPYIPDVYLFGV